MPSSSVSKMRNKQKRRNRKTIKQRKISAESHDELISRVKQKFGINSKKSKEGELKEALLDSNNGKINHPISYQRIMARTFESHLNRILQPEAPEDLLPSNWICAICFQPPANSNNGNIQITSNPSNSSGELFGPYFVQLSPNFQPPEILVPRQMLEQYNQQNLTPISRENSAVNKCLDNSTMSPKKDAVKKLNKKTGGNIKKITLDGKLDLWFHGECALEVPDLILIGGRFPNLEHQIAKYWASIGIKTNH